MKVEAFLHPMMIEIGGRFSYVNTWITTPATPKGTVLCLHEFTARGALFQPLADQLAAQGWKVVAPDMPGRGQSHRLPADLYTSRTYLDVLAAVLRLHNLNPLVILGIGWGALLALGLENLWRPKPVKLVLCDLPMTWQFSTDPRTQLMAQLCNIVAQNDEDFRVQAGRLCLERPDIIADVMGRLTGPKGARSLGTDPKVFDTLPRNPKTAFSSLAMLRACTTPTDLVYGHQAAPMHEFDAITAQNPAMTVRQIAAENFFDCAEPSTLPALCDAIHLAHPSSQQNRPAPQTVKNIGIWWSLGGSNP